VRTDRRKKTLDLLRLPNFLAVLRRIVVLHRYCSRKSFRQIAPEFPL